MTHQDSASKRWEQTWNRRLPPDKPWILRLDGRSFHRWTRGLDQPFDERLREAMVRTTIATMDTCGAEHGYTQSDEITLVLHRSGRSEEAFGGKLQKLVSLAAAHATIAFNAAFATLHPEHAARAGPATFDARAFAVPNPEAAITALAERAGDCARNAARSIGHHRYGHRALLGMSSAALRQRLETDGTAIGTWPARHTGGVACDRIRIIRAFTTDEIEALPPRHAARTDPALTVERTTTVPAPAPDYTDAAAAHARVFEWRTASPTKVDKSKAGTGHGAGRHEDAEADHTEKVCAAMVRHGIHEVRVRIGLEHRSGWKTYDVTVREADPCAGAEPEPDRTPLAAETDLESAARAAALGIAAKRLRGDAWYTRGVIEFHRSAEGETRRAPRADVHLQVAGPVL